MEVTIAHVTSPVFSLKERNAVISVVHLHIRPSIR